MGVCRKTPWTRERARPSSWTRPGGSPGRSQAPRGSTGRERVHCLARCPHIVWAPAPRWRTCWDCRRMRSASSAARTARRGPAEVEADSAADLAERIRFLASKVGPRRPFPQFRRNAKIEWVFVDVGVFYNVDRTETCSVSIPLSGLHSLVEEAPCAITSEWPATRAARGKTRNEADRAAESGEGGGPVACRWLP